jgi:voltage-gated potassium channel
MRIYRPRLVRREIERFRADPASMRNAMVVIVTLTVASVVVGSLFMWLFDRDGFPNFGTAFWFVLQTVTTVGYGDVTPTTPEGRVVAGIVMVVAIAFLSIITAMITSTFIEAAQRQRRADDTNAEQDRNDRVDARFDEIAHRLTAIEAALGVGAAPDITAATAEPRAGAVPPSPPDSTRPDPED